MNHRMIRIARRGVGAKLLSVVAPLLACLSALACFAAQAAQAALVLAVHPYLPAAEVHSRFGPFAEYLSRELGRPVSVRVGSDYAEHERVIGKDQVDIAFLGPAAYVQVVRQFGAKPLLARFEVAGQPNLYGVIAVRKDSAVTTLAGLKEARIAFGDPESTMSHIVPRYLLMRAGVSPGAGRYRFLGSHKNVAMAVLAGDDDAGAMKKEVFDEFASRGLRALVVTPGVPDHLFVTRASMPKGDVKRLREAMQHLQDRPDGRSIMNRMHQDLTGLVPARDSDYEGLRGMVATVKAPSR